jgi:tetratricopeptide (TPR) repeat protein
MNVSGQSVDSEFVTDIMGATVALRGKFGGMKKKDVAQLIKSNGGNIVDTIDSHTDIVVIGANELALDGLQTWLDEHSRNRAAQGQLEIISETQLWQRLGLVEPEQQIHRLYTPAMLAQLLELPLAVIRRWHRRGLIAPVREFFKLPYFDFQEVVMARRLAEVLAAGASPSAIETKLKQLSEFLPEVERRISQLAVIVEGKDLLLRQGGGLIEPGGQLRIDFDSLENSNLETLTAPAQSLPFKQCEIQTDTQNFVLPNDYLELANALEEEERISEAIEVFRSMILAFGPSAESCFQLGDLLLRIDDLPAARERYYMAIELDAELVEARASLGCVLQKEGNLHLAVSAFEGAINCYGDYPDAHFHLARTYEQMGRHDDAYEHWVRFLELAPTSPWADEARDQINGIKL